MTAILVLSGLGFVCGLALAVASRVFYLPEDPSIEAVRGILPGANCAACGYPGCEAAAKAVVAGDAPLDVCIYGGHDIADQISEALGLEIRYRETQLATVLCNGGQKAANRYDYDGAMDCRAAVLLDGGFKECPIGCLGLGTCATVCPFDAIRMNAEELPEIDPNRCRGCGRCSNVCPKGIIAVTGMTDRLLRLSQSEDCLSPCTQKCPAQIDVPRFIQQLQCGDYAAALLTVKERNPLPIANGRICTHPCENICRRNIADEAVSINRLERFLGDWEMKSGRRLPLACAPDTGHQVAIVGGGPAGLSCAYFLRRLGHRPVIFEAMPELGGMLRYGIAEYRLPKKEVNWEIQGILDLGVEARTGVRLGKDFDLLTFANEGFEAVVLAIGAWVTPFPNIPGIDAKGVLGSIDFLDRVGTEITNLENKKIVVIGESNAAMDSARSAIRLGAKAVTVICPCEQKKMSARKRDVVRAIEEGVRIEFLTSPVKIVSGAVKAVTHVGYVQKFSDDSSGKNISYGSSENAGEMLRIAADMVIVALERVPDLSCLTDEKGRCPFEITAKGTLAADGDTLQTSVPHVFTAGDMHTGRASVISAVGAGRLAARSVHFFLTEGRIPLPDNIMHGIIPQSILKKVIVREPIERVKMVELPPELRRRSFVEEVIGAMSEEQAHMEACRCLQCGLICYDH